jgi:hypothetical protein
VFLGVLYIVRQVGFGFGFFTVAYSLVATIVITKLIGKKISYERPLGAALGMFLHELAGPRGQTKDRGAAASPSGIRVREQRPRPRLARRGGNTAGARPTSAYRNPAALGPWQPVPGSQERVLTGDYGSGTSTLTNPTVRRIEEPGRG